jgi:hypothetical protein
MEEHFMLSIAEKSQTGILIEGEKLKSCTN